MEQGFLVLKTKNKPKETKTQPNICSKYNTGEYNMKKLMVSQPAFVLLRK